MWHIQQLASQKILKNTTTDGAAKFTDNDVKKFLRFVNIFVTCSLDVLKIYSRKPSSFIFTCGTEQDNIHYTVSTIQ